MKTNICRIVCSLAIVLGVFLGTMVKATIARSDSAPSVGSTFKNIQLTEANPKVDPAIVSTWETMVPNAQGVARWVWEIHADGIYSFHSEGSGAAPPHSGNVTFINGQWALQATTGLPGWTDGGTYQISDPNTLVVTGRLGTGIWRRSSTQAVASAASVPEMAAKARKRAKRWRNDAILREINAELRPPTYERRSPADMYNFTFIFYSPSEQARFIVMPGNPVGEEFLGGYVNWTEAETQPIPDKFLDLSEAVAQAQAAGMRGKAQRATLRVWISDGRMEGLMWLIWPVDATTTYPVDAQVKTQAAKDTDLNEPWQTSWDEFVKEVQRLYKSGAKEDEFIKRFNGKKVLWEGRIVEVDTSEDLKKVVTIQMSAYNVTLPDGRVVKMDEVVLPVKGSFSSTTNKKVRFQATLNKGSEIFPAAVTDVRIKYEKSGEEKTIITIDLREGSILE